MRDVTFTAEVVNLSNGRHGSLVAAVEPRTRALLGSRFIYGPDFPTEGEFRAAVADALAQLLDETL